MIMGIVISMLMNMLFIDKVHNTSYYFTKKIVFMLFNVVYFIFWGIC